MTGDDIKNVILDNFDTTHYTIGDCEYQELEPAISCGYGYIIYHGNLNLAPSGQTYQQTSAFGGQWFTVACIGETETEVKNLVDALIKIIDTYEGNTTYSRMEADLKNLIWDNWNDDKAHFANRRRVDVPVLMSLNDSNNYVI